MEGELCRMCGGDGRVGNAFGGAQAKCPSCHGTGRRAEAVFGFHDVTKTKPSHYRAAPQVAAGPKVPVTAQGVQLASEVSASPVLSADAKTRLIVEIVNHESTHGLCTKTFVKKVRKQTRPVS
jgi:DnaJ-class molecular chaperone